MKKIYLNLITSGLILSALFFTACQKPATNNAPDVGNNKVETGSITPSIEVAPAKVNGEYQMLTADKFKISVNADGAQQVDLFYQPVMSSEMALKLTTLTAPKEGTDNLFESEMQAPEDFNGEVWALVKYADGTNKETAHLNVARQGQLENNGDQKSQVNSNSNSIANQNQAADDNDSARSDKKTGGKIQHAELQAGKGNIHLSVNVPQFLLTVWQGDKEIKTYYVGVGRKNFPIPTGMRSAEKIILNPDWIPPNSEWVRKSSSIEPYERIPASSSENPLGKIKIPLGDAYLLHEADSKNDIGNLVSHGCVRVLREDIFDLTQLIVKAMNLSISQDEINAAKNDSKRRVIELGQEIPVDINYNTMVVENGILTIYPDVYEKNTNTVEELKAELEGNKIDASKIDAETLKSMLDKVDKDHKFVISLDDLRAGKALQNGKIEPLTPFQKDDSSNKKNT